MLKIQITIIQRGNISRLIHLLRDKDFLVFEISSLLSKRLSVYLIINTRSASSESESLSKDSTDNRISGDSQSEGQLSLDVPDSR